MLSKKDPQIKEAVVTLMELSQDERTRLLYEEELKTRRDEYAKIQYGKEEGEQLKAIEIAQNLLKMKLPPDQISQATGLSAEEINKLPH